MFSFIPPSQAVMLKVRIGSFPSTTSNVNIIRLFSTLHVG